MAMPYLSQVSITWSSRTEPPAWAMSKGFWGANGVSLQRGFSTPELKEAMVKRKSMENCRDCYILADESKFSQISSVTFAPVEKATVITTELKQEIYKDCSNIINIE